MISTRPNIVIMGAIRTRSGIVIMVPIMPVVMMAPVLSPVTAMFMVVFEVRSIPMGTIMFNMAVNRGIRPDVHTDATMVSGSKMFLLFFLIFRP